MMICQEDFSKSFGHPSLVPLSPFGFLVVSLFTKWLNAEYFIAFSHRKKIQFGFCGTIAGVLLIVLGKILNMVIFS